MSEDHHPRLFCFKPIAGPDGTTDGEPGSWGHREICIRPGMWMSWINSTLSAQVCLEYEKQFPVIDFGFVLSGRILKKGPGQDTLPDHQQAMGGISGVRLETRQSGEIVVPAGQEHQLLHLHMTLSAFRELVRDQAGLLPPSLKAVLNGDDQAEFTSTRPMAPDIQAVVYQLMNTSSNAYPWAMYLQGKGLELLSLHLAALSMDQPRGIRLNKSEQERVVKARSILVNDLHSPVALQDLSSRVGLNVAKLQAGFKQAFGMSVFEYFREFRMQKARQLLAGARANVSETAWEVGYVNVSHFSAAFKKRFGILPKHYMKMHLG